MKNTLLEILRVLVKGPTPRQDYEALQLQLRAIQIEADVIRDQMDRAWRRLSPQEQAELNGYPQQHFD